MTDLELMQDIKARFGETIAAAASVSSVPAAFLAALIANESGGNVNAKRFEHGVLAALWEVLLGRKEAYGSIKRVVLVSYVTGVSVPTINAPSSLPANAFQCVDALVTSWGLTQIMGYHTLEFGVTFDNLISPASGLGITTKMLAGFAREFQLDVTKEFSSMFTCWNAGSPRGQTFDPQYVSNGLARMALWNSLT
jgi:hypothetical protein